MTRLWRSWTVLPVGLIVLLAAGGCSESDNEIQANQPPPGAGGGGPPGIRQIMNKLGRGPNALTPVIGNELQQEPPPWDTIQGQAKEYAQSAAELGKFDPPKGAKESWVKLTAAFADSALSWKRPRWPRIKRPPGFRTTSSRTRATRATKNTAGWAAAAADLVVPVGRLPVDQVDEADSAGRQGDRRQEDQEVRRRVRRSEFPDEQAIKPGSAPLARRNSSIVRFPHCMWLRHAARRRSTPGAVDSNLHRTFGSSVRDKWRPCQFHGSQETVAQTS